MPPTTPSNIRSTIDAIWRRESASLMSVVRNLSLAEDLTHLEALANGVRPHMRCALREIHILGTALFSCTPHIAAGGNAGPDVY